MGSEQHWWGHKAHADTAHGIRQKHTPRSTSDVVRNLSLLFAWFISCVFADSQFWISDSGLDTESTFMRKQSGFLNFPNQRHSWDLSSEISQQCAVFLSVGFCCFVFDVRVYRWAFSFFSLQCGLWVSRAGINWEFVRKTKSQISTRPTELGSAFYQAPETICICALWEALAVH